MEATVKAPPRLARGLNALLGDISAPSSDAPVAKLPLGKIAFNPYQPRKQFDDEELASLAASIKTHGVLQPLVVRAAGEEYQLIAGERRLRAARSAGLAEVPVHVVHFEDQQVFEAALVENIQRTDLNPLEKAQGFKEYMDKFKMTQDQLAGRLGLDRTTVTNLLGLLNLHPDVQAAVRNGQLTMGHAKVLKGVTDLEQQLAFAKDAIMKNYSVHALELLVKQHKLAAAGTELAAAAPAEKKEPAEKTAHVKGLEDDLRQRLAVKIEIKVKAKDKGQIVIGFDSNDDFERIIQALQK
ncbi:ParB/RepB/Spo0J family partition protein [Gemmata obscuriglobus]|uniref:Chromosome partitioning protein ParB n=1 Tax=Gemmata obscuriglobus TaxID=114 RepID=A0A2Z3H6C5_9BACT|nr:ParB/RepB/Spo0J family partition protein [Gemmata obscuriglobus]AWM41308.1 chromosome partitioning protein ParB [Gemmata obscuriglobus]